MWQWIAKSDQDFENSGNGHPSLTKAPPFSCYTLSVIQWKKNYTSQLVLCILWVGGFTKKIPLCTFLSKISGRVNWQKQSKSFLGCCVYLCEFIDKHLYNFYFYEKTTFSQIFYKVMNNSCLTSFQMFLLLVSKASLRFFQVQSKNQIRSGWMSDKVIHSKSGCPGCPDFTQITLKKIGWEREHYQICTISP